MSKSLMMLVLIAGFVPAQVAIAGCWECEDTQEYPWVACAPVSISDQGKTESQVNIDPHGLNKCVFSGQVCEWQAPQSPETPPPVPPQQGCEDTRLSTGPKTEELVTPNGQFTSAWVPKAPSIGTAVG